MNKDNQLIFEAYRSRHVPIFNTGDKVVLDWTRTGDRNTGVVINDYSPLKNSLIIRVNDPAESSQDNEYEYEYQSRKGCWFEINNIGDPITITKQGKISKIDPGAPGSALEQHADLMTPEEQDVFISSGHDLDAVKKFRTLNPKNKPPKLTINDKVKVSFQSFDTHTGVIIKELGNDRYIASFGKGKDAFKSAIKYATWNNGKSYSWKEDPHYPIE